MNRAMPAEIVITGIGICSPLGPDRETTWRRLLAGDSGLAWIDAERRWAGGRVAAPSDSGWHAMKSSTGVAIAREPRPSQNLRACHPINVGSLAECVAAEAIHDACLQTNHVDPARLGCVFGTSKGELRRLLGDTTDDSSPWLDAWPSGAASRLAARWNCQGPVLAPVAACATGLTAAIRAAELIAEDACDVVLAGSADASLFPAVIASFQRLGVLARSFDDPAAAVRPFDRRHAGFLIGEGAACLVLERRDHAERRGLDWYGEWLGGRLGSDPAGITQTDAEGASLARLLADLARQTGVAPDVINLHGTATKLNDRAECRAVRSAFGPDAVRMMCSGVKGSIGHLLGAAGSVELALTLLGLRDQIVPPTINLDDPADGCELNFVREPVNRPIQTALKISAGFGGHLAAAAVQRGTRRA